ncbi:MAG: hypothetical protein M1418_07500, partial [Deltaproteobacteria bacterium]|nr:hypothetical protein [Deltaproteobacteria bacterium]
MDNMTCVGCGEEIAGEGDIYCSDCKLDIRRRNRKRLLYSVVAAVILLFAGTIFLYGEKNAWEFSWDSLLRRPAAVVNGEPIAWSDARERLD